MCAFERLDVREAAAEEHRRGNDEHRHVDQARDRHRDQHVDARVPVQRPRLVVVARDDAVLGQRGVQVDHVRHDRRAENADGEQYRLVALEVGDDRVLGDRPERRVGEPELSQVADADHGDERRDHSLERPEAEALQTEDQERDHAGQHSRRKERDSEQQLQPEGRAEELGEVGRHRDRLGLDPQEDRRAVRELFATELGQVAAGGNPELRGE